MATIFLISLARANWLPFLFALIALVLAVKGLERLFYYIKGRMDRYKRLKSDRHDGFNDRDCQN